MTHDVSTMKNQQLTIVPLHVYTRHGSLHTTSYRERIQRTWTIRWCAQVHTNTRERADDISSLPLPPPPETELYPYARLDLSNPLFQEVCACVCLNLFVVLV